jgi:hypothetical protein
MNWRLELKKQNRIIWANIKYGVLAVLNALWLVMLYLKDAAFGFLLIIVVIVFLPLLIPLQIILLVCGRRGFFYVQSESQSENAEDNQGFLQLLIEPFYYREENEDL